MTNSETPTTSPGATDAATTELAAQLRVALARSTRRIRRERASAGAISDAQYSVLARLFIAGPQTIGALAEFDRVQPPSMTRTVGCLESDGLVTRKPHPKDGRVVVVDLTGDGRREVHEARSRTTEWLATQLETLTDEQRRTLSDAAEILLELSQR